MKKTPKVYSMFQSPQINGEVNKVDDEDGGSVFGTSRNKAFGPEPHWALVPDGVWTGSRGGD